MSKHVQFTEKTETPKCRTCGKILIGKNAIDVGYCIPCYHDMMADDEDDETDINYDFHEGRGENNELL